MKFLCTMAAVLTIAFSGGEAAAQQPKTLKDQLVGAWNFVVAEITAPDGRKSFPFGETPRGILVFTPDGHFAQIHIASDTPKIASGNRLKGTPEEYQAIMHKSISLFGTYSVDESRKTVTYHVVSSSFPNWAGQSQTRVIDLLTADEFRNTNPNVPGGRGSALNLYKRVK